MQTIEEIVIDDLNRDFEAPMFIKHEGEKARKFFADTNIPQHTFVCEYKTTNVNNEKEHER